MKSKRKYNRKNTLKRKDTRMRTRRSKKRKYSKRRKKMKGGTGPDKIYRPYTTIYDKDGKPVILEREEAVEEREMAESLMPRLPSVHEEYPSERFFNILDLVFRDDGVVVTDEKYKLKEKTHGIISAHGEAMDLYFIVPDGITLIFFISDGDYGGITTASPEVLRRMDEVSEAKFSPYLNYLLAIHRFLIGTTNLFVEYEDKNAEEFRISAMRSLFKEYLNKQRDTETLRDWATENGVNPEWEEIILEYFIPLIKNRNISFELTERKDFISDFFREKRDFLRPIKFFPSLRGDYSNQEFTRVYPSGSLCRNYSLEFRPSMGDSTRYRFVGLFSIPEIELTRDKENDDDYFFRYLDEQYISGGDPFYKNPNPKCVDGETEYRGIPDKRISMMTEMCRKLTSEEQNEFIVDEYGMLEDMWETNGYKIEDLGSLLYSLKDEEKPLPKYFICNFCRSHKREEEELIQRLKNCDFPKYNLKKLPTNFLPNDTIDESPLDLRKNTSLTRAEVFRNFGKIVNELLTFFETNKQRMKSDRVMKDRYDKLNRIIYSLQNIQLRDICFILQLRYTLSA